MSDYPMLISNKLHSFRNFAGQRYVCLNVLSDGICLNRRMYFYHINNARLGNHLKRAFSI